jgi:hypothetical protein
MQTRTNAPIRKSLIGILLVILLVWTVLPASPALAKRETTPASGRLPSGLLTADGALNLTTGFNGVLDLSGWEVSLDTQRGPLFHLGGNPPSSPAFSGGDWSALGEGMSNWVRAIAISGSTVYAAGDFWSAGACSSSDGCNNIARWNGSTWSPLGTGTNGGTILTLAVSGSTLYAGGNFLTAGNCTSGCSRIAKWNGSAWSALGTGMDDGVWALAVSGSDLYAGGYFTNAGTCTSGCNHIAKWNGGTWSPLGTGTDDNVLALAVSGTTLYAGGDFTSAGACTGGCNHIAKWNGATWSALGTGTNDYVNTIAIGAGGELYAGGYFTSAGTCSSSAGCNYIAKWNASTWSPLGTGMDSEVNAIAVNGGAVYAGGWFASSGTCWLDCSHIAKWNGSTWSALGTGTNYDVAAIAVNGSTLYAGGGFWAAGICTNSDGCNYIAKYIETSTYRVYLPIAIR